MKDLTRMKICMETGTNMDKLQLLPCGCGGEAHHDSASCWNPEEEEWMPNFWHRVICKNCGTQTKAFYTEAEAIEAWNKAMGKDIDVPAKERTYKVTDIHVDEYYCPACGAEILHDHEDKGDNYCRECGAKLDWSEE